MSRRLRVGIAGALLTVVSMAWTASPAGGHAVLTASDPPDGASVEEAPAEVLLTFSEAPDPALAVVQVLDRSGQPVEIGGVEPLAGRPEQLRVPLGTLAEGTYTVTWRTTSAADGHTTAGAVAFGVGVSADAVSAEPTAVLVGLPAPTAAAVAGRWLFYVGVVLLLGAAVVGGLVVAEPASVTRWPLAVAWVAAAGGLALTIADQRASTQASLADLVSSSTGRKLAAQALTLALAGAAVAWARLRPSRPSLALVGTAAAAAMLARAFSGHANASSMRGLAVGMQWVHLVSVGAWVGGLVWLLVAMRRGDPGQGRGLARRFSAVATGTLAVVAVSGTVRALDEVGAWARLVDTSFGVTLLVKVGLFTALVVLAARSHFHHVPSALASGWAGLRRAVRGEVAIAAGVLGATALLAGLPPAASLAAVPDPASPAVTAAPGERAGCPRGSPDPTYDVAIDLEPDPPRAEGTTFHLAVRRDGAPVTGAKVCLKVDMPDMQHPGAFTVAEEVSPGAYDVRLQFSMTGTWSGSITVVEPEGAAASVPVTFEVE